MAAQESATTAPPAAALSAEATGIQAEVNELKREIAELKEDIRKNKKIVEDGLDRGTMSVEFAISYKNGITADTNRLRDLEARLDRLQQPTIQAQMAEGEPLLSSKRPHA